MLPVVYRFVLFQQRMHPVMMAVRSCICAVYMGVTVCDGVSMRHAVVGVGECVRMGMGVLCLQGIQYHQNRAGKHYR